MGAKMNKQTNNNNMSANNKQTNTGSARVGAVWGCAVMEFSAQCVRVRRKAPEMYRRYAERLWRHIGDTMEKARRLIVQVIL